MRNNPGAVDSAYPLVAFAADERKTSKTSLSSDVSVAVIVIIIIIIIIVRLNLAASSRSVHSNVARG